MFGFPKYWLFECGSTTTQNGPWEADVKPRLEGAVGEHALLEEQTPPVARPA